MSISDSATKIVPARKRRPFDGRALNRPSSVRGLSKRVAAAIERMVREGLPRDDAAKAVGLKDDTLYRAFRNPVVRTFYKNEVDALRTSEHARNIHTGVEVRDDKTQPGKTRVDAAKYLDGDSRGITVNVGIQNNISPGYIVDVSQTNDQEVAAILRRAGSTGNVIEHEADEGPAESNHDGPP